jgi:integrase
VSLGYFPNGKRRIGTVSARTKTEAKNKLRSLIRNQEDGVPIGQRGYTVEEAVESWLDHGMTGRDPNTLANRAILARTHLIPALGRRRLADLSAEEVDAWLASKAGSLSSDTLARLLGILRAAIRRAQARDYVKRNVALLRDPPKGRAGRPSKSLDVDQAARLVAAAFADETVMRAYVIVSLLTGARIEELRALTWHHVDLDGDPPTVSLWRSVRASGDTKTKKSRRTLELPGRCVEVLRFHRREQLQVRVAAGERWVDLDLVFATSLGSPLDAANVRRAFRRVAVAAGLDAATWTPRELRHSFVSLLSSTGLSIEDISHLVGRANTRVTGTCQPV